MTIKEPCFQVKLYRVKYSGDGLIERIKLVYATSEEEALKIFKSNCSFWVHEHYLSCEEVEKKIGEL